VTTQTWQQLMDSAGGGFEPLPQGVYDVQAETTESKKTANGKDMVKVKYTVTSGPHANRRVWNQYVVSPENPNAMSFFFQHLGAHGLTSAFIAQCAPGEAGVAQMAAAMLGTQVRLELGVEMYQGQNRNKVVKVMPPTAGTGMPSPQGMPAAAAPAPAPPAAPPLPPAAPAAPTPAPPVPPTPETPDPAPAPAPPAPPVPEPAATAPETPPQPPAPPAPPVPPTPAEQPAAGGPTVPY
jgi:hypothetical protein